MGSIAFTVPSEDDLAARLLQLVATYGGVRGELKIATGAVEDVEFVGPDGGKAFGSNTACQFLASLSRAAPQLLGETLEQQAQASSAPVLGRRRAALHQY